MKVIRSPSGEAKKYYAKRRETAHKDVERAFSMFQARFAVVKYPSLSWSLEQMWEIINTCVIMHNMIIESERDAN